MTGDVKNGNERYKIIIVVDDRLLTDIETRVNRLGVEVVAKAGSAEEALVKVEAIPADLVLIDISIEGVMSGIETARTLRRLYKIPVVFIADQQDEDTIDRAKSADPFGFIFKPIRDRVFQVTLDMALSRGREEKLRKSAEIEFERSAEEWQSTFDAINDCVALIDPSGVIVRCNTAMTRFLGKPYNEIIGGKCWELVHGTDEPIDNCPFVRMMSTLSRESMILPVNHHWYHVTVDPMCDSDGNLITAAHIMMDITGQKQAEKELEESERKYREFVEGTDDLITQMDDKGRFLYVNHVAEKIFGLPADDCVGLSAFEFLHPDDRERTCEWLSGLVDNRQRSGNIENRQVSRNGQTHNMLWTSNLHYKDQGKLSYINGIARNITERRRADEAVRESEERIRATFNAITDSVFLHPLLDEGFARFLDVNETACERYGYSRAEFLSLKAPDITVKSDANLHASRVHRQKLREKGRLIFEATHKTSFGEEFPVEINSAVIELGGRPVILAVVRDITERKFVELQKEKLIMELHDALREIKELRGFLPICANCKKIRDDEGYWQQIEKYIMDRTDAQFSHSICPDCAKILYPEYYK